MKKLSVKMKITLWYTGLIVIILSAIFTAVLLATDKVLLLGVQNKLEEEVYDFAEELKVDSNGRLRLEKLDFLKDGVRLAVYHENGQMITGLVASGLPETPFADELLQKAGSDQQNWFVYDFYFKPRHADNFYWVRGTVPLSSAYAERDKILRQCALFFPLLVLLAALGGYWITKKAFRPVTRITEAAAQISSGSDLSKRIELEGADDEIDTLAKTFDGMFARLEDAFEAERQFTDDASHELRTPTSVIIAQAECGLQSPDLESKQQALQGVLQQAGKMSKLVNQRFMLSLHHNPVLRLLFPNRADFETVVLFLGSNRPGVDGIHQKVFDNGEVPHIPPVFRVFLFPFGAGIAKPPFPVPPCGAGDFFFLQPSADIVRTMTV